MAIKTLRVFAEYTSTGFVPMPVAGGIDYGYTLANTFPSTQPSTFQTDDPDLDVTVTAMTDFYVWIRISGTAWNPSYTRNVRVYPDSPDINSVVMNMIIATGPAGVSSYTQIVQTANRLYFNGATTDSVYNSKFAGKTYINELNFGTAPQLATVATSGAYADLSGKPALATVATSGSYADLSSKPSGTAPISYNSGTNSFQITQANSTTNGFLTSTDWNTFNNKYLLPSGGTTAQYLRGDGTLATFPTTLDSTRLILNGRNTTGTTLTKGTVVYINGVSGNTPLFARAIASADSTSAQTLGVVEFDIPNNSNGVVVLVGAVNNLDTSSYTEGVQLYLSGTVAGAFTSSKILAPTHLVYVGIVTRAHPTLGVVEVKIQNGYELDEIHDVQISSPTDKDILYYDNATTLWKHAGVTSVLGFTPYNATNPNNFIARTALSASAPLSYNNTTGAFSIAQANGSTNGFLSSSDWTTFNNKQNALTLGNVSEVISNVLMFPDGGTNKTIGNLTIQVVQASASTNGFLSSANWTTFNNKQNAITLTTTGTSGAATLSGATLNIPQYQTALTNPVTGTGTTNFIPKFTGSSAIGNSVMIESSNSIGMGISPSSWAIYRSFQIGWGSIASYDAADTAIFSNTYFDGGTWRYIGTGNASQYRQINSIHSWHTAPSGTAGNAITFTQAMTLDASGRLFIGATSGIGNDRVLIVTDSSGTFTQALNLKDSNASANNTNFIVIRKSDDTYLGTIGRSGTDNAMAVNGNSYLSLQTGLTERMRITSTGNVGIGTSSPSQALHVRKNGTTSAIVIDSENTSYQSTLYYARGGTNKWEHGMTSTNEDWYLYGSNWALYVARSTGNLGVGTTSPFSDTNYVSTYIGGTTGGQLILGNSTGGAANRFLLLQGDSSAASILAVGSRPMDLYTNSALRMRINANGTTFFGNDMFTYGNGGIFFSGNGSYSSGIFQLVGTLGLALQTTSAIRVFITQGGNILMGTQTDNGERLYVSGSIRATGNITANSDLTLKKNLQLIDNPTEKLMSLNGYSYQWKENDEYQYGVIAQEVEKVMSYAVQTGNNGIKGVAYNQLTPLLIEGFKLHNQKIDLNTSRITQLENEVQYLKAKLA